MFQVVDRNPFQYFKWHTFVMVEPNIDRLHFWITHKVDRCRGQFVQIYILSCPRGAEICLTMHQKDYHRSPGCTLEVINQGLNQRK